MKKNLFFICLLSLALAACHTGGEEPTPDQKPEDKPQKEYKQANKFVAYQCNERLFSRENAFQTIQAYVPTLQEMQVNVLWLMPIHPRGTENSVNSPYCVKDFKAIEPAFGTMADLKALVDDCHSRGMLVILDWIANHTAWDNQWHKDHPEWYTTPVADEVGWKDVAPLDYNKQEVRDAMTDALLYWVREAGIDGYRCDYAHGVPTDYWQSAIAEIRKLKPNAIMLAETSKTEYYGAGFDWLYSWSYLGAVQKIYSSKVSTLFNISQGEFNNTPSGKDRLRYVTTHDASSENAPSSWYKTAKGELAASVLTFFIGGVPMIYSSQEIGDTQKINFFNYKLLNFSGDNEIRDAYIKVMKAYINTAEARYGDIVDYSTDHVAMFTRTQHDKSVLVIVNASGADQDITLPMTWQRDRCYDAIACDSVTTPKSETLGAYEYMIYTK
ncbi:MAG: alpha-amylase [Bacteroidales bacterium]|nr:alpha-amylase [Candidatus Colicola faecequi]